MGFGASLIKTIVIGLSAVRKDRFNRDREMREILTHIALK